MRSPALIAVHGVVVASADGRHAPAAQLGDLVQQLGAECEAGLRGRVAPVSDQMQDWVNIVLARDIQQRVEMAGVACGTPPLPSKPMRCRHLSVALR